MNFLPVLDIRGGIVVRALAGRRAEYQPLTSRLTDSTDPLAVATAIRDRFGWADVYVADLDSITACRFAPDLALIERFRAAGFRLWLDAGVRTAADADHIAVAGLERVVVGLETLGDLAAWREIVSRLGAELAVFSLDLRDGRPLASAPLDAVAAVERIVTDGGRQLIVLDLARVGLGSGPGTESLCAELVRRHPGLTVYAGGGVRGREDVRRLEAAGVTGVLLASALHDGAFV
ncbi:MAG TPA: HisA/HisF-related TIM barrel protein [Gemmataceae bacterium]|jgi:phosphoribosylformimino-5-aminoimidazole carboxamide ribotide isomerase